jgi:hypothetical protein
VIKKLRSAMSDHLSLHQKGVRSLYWGKKRWHMLCGCVSNDHSPFYYFVDIRLKHI